MGLTKLSIAGTGDTTASSIVIKWKWEQTSNVTSLPADYVVQVATDAGFSQNVSSQTINDETNSGGPIFQGTIRNLYRFTNYYIRIRARQGSELGPWSQATIAATYSTTPNAPRPYYIDAQGQTGIHYLFNGPDDDGGSAIREYQIGYGTDPNNVQATFNVGGGDAWINGLNRYTTYYVWSRARNDNGWGPWSVRFEQRTRAYVPSPPSPVALDNITQISVRYVFRGEDNGGSDVLEWQVGYGTDPNNVQTTIGSNGESYIGGLSPYTRYYFWSRGRNVEGWGGWSARVDARTQAGAKVRGNDGVSRDAIPYVKESGVWRLARPYVKRIGLWKTTE